MVMDIYYVIYMSHCHTNTICLFSLSSSLTISVDSDYPLYTYLHREVRRAQEELAERHAAVARAREQAEREMQLRHVRPPYLKKASPPIIVTSILPFYHTFYTYYAISSPVILTPIYTFIYMQARTLEREAAAEARRQMAREEQQRQVRMAKLNEDEKSQRRNEVLDNYEKTQNERLRHLLVCTNRVINIYYLIYTTIIILSTSSPSINNTTAIYNRMYGLTYAYIYIKEYLVPTFACVSDLPVYVYLCMSICV